MLLQTQTLGKAQERNVIWMSEALQTEGKFVFDCFQISAAIFLTQNIYPYHPHGNNAENCRFRSKRIPWLPRLSQRTTPSPLSLWRYTCLFADVYTVCVHTYTTLNSTRPHLSVQPSPLPSNLLSCLSSKINLILFIFPLFPVIHNLTALPVPSLALFLLLSLSILSL